MMKGQLAGLMKQAQQMQDNMKKAQEQLANIEWKASPAPAW
jgi:DNA-binding protein YbaB